MIVGFTKMVKAQSDWFFTSGQLVHSGNLAVTQLEESGTVLLGNLSFNG